jgi:hypothetical protein
LKEKGEVISSGDLWGAAGFIISGMPGRKPAYLTYPNQVDPSGSTKNDFQIPKTPGESVWRNQDLDIMKFP